MERHSVSESIKRKSTLKRKSQTQKKEDHNSCIEKFIKENPINKFIEKDITLPLVNLFPSQSRNSYSGTKVLSPSQTVSFLEFLKLYNKVSEYTCALMTDADLKYNCMRYTQPDVNKLEYFINLYNHCYKLKLPVISIAKYKKNKNEASGKLLNEYIDIFSVYGGLKPNTPFSKRRTVVVTGNKNYNSFSKFKSENHFGRQF
jgi:hypothetical protein